MTLIRVVAPAVLLVAASMPANAASFDCAAAKTPFEHAICDNPNLSRADEVLAISFATATGGLTKAAVSKMRADQRGWLDYAGRACTDDAQPMTTGSYDETGASCLADKFSGRSTALEASRMMGGHRFYLNSVYGAEPDPDEVDNNESYWKVASQELSFPQLDGDDALAAAFNTYVSARAAEISSFGSSDGEASGASADSSVEIDVKELGGANRITLEVSTYWYGHGAAHGNYTLSYLHYYVPEEREVVAADIFSGENWQATLADAAWAQLQTQHKEWLQVESEADIADAVADPTRWDLSNDYGLTIQFQPYEVAAYAYGAPTITIPWDKLDVIKADSQDNVRYGY